MSVEIVRDLSAAAASEVIHVDGEPVSKQNPIPVAVEGILADVDIDFEPADLGAGAEGAAIGATPPGLLVQDDTGGSDNKRKNFALDADGHLQADVLTAPAVRALTSADVVTAEVSKDAIMGTTADAPSTDDESATVRTGISLFKGIKNYLKTLASTVTGSKVQVDVATAPAVRALTNTDVVTAELSSTDNAVLDAIAAAVGTNDVAHTVDFAASEIAQTIWTPAGGKKFLITGWHLHFSAAGTITVWQSATNDASGRVFKQAGAAVGAGSTIGGMRIVGAAADGVLRYTTGAGAAGSLTVYGHDVT